MATTAVHDSGRYYWDALAQALAEGRRDICGTINAHDLLGTTALHYAAHAGAASAMRALVAAGANLDPRTQFSSQSVSDSSCEWRLEPGWTPLMLACRFGHHECVSVLVAAGASVHASLQRSQGIACIETPLALSAEIGCLRSVQTLLAAGASVRVPADSWSPLHAAIWGSFEARCECAAALLRAGADVNALDHVGRSPLDLGAIAIANRKPRNRRLIMALLREGARLPEANPPVSPFLPQKLRAYYAAIRRAGGYARYETMRRAPFATVLTRCGGFPIPSDTIQIVVAFWVRRALEY